MLSSTNLCMGLAGLIYLVAGIFILRKELSAARGWDKLVTLGPVFIAASLAVFAPEHFHGGPAYIQKMAPSWVPTPAPWFWPYFVGCALLAAATSLMLRKFVRLSSTLLGLMFFLFVCMIYLPSALKYPGRHGGWVLVLRESSFAAGAWAIAGLQGRASSPQLSKWMILFGRTVIAIAAVFYGVQHFLRPAGMPDLPLGIMTPSWVPFPSVWGYLGGAVLVVAGIGLVLNKTARMAATSIGVFMTAVVLFLDLPILVLACSGPVPGTNDALNYVGDTLLYAGSVLALAAALPRGAEKS